MGKKLIKVNKELRGALVEEFGVSVPTLYRYLRYDCDTYTARMMRARALELGGRIVEQKDVTDND